MAYLVVKETKPADGGHTFNLDDVRINNDQESKNKYKETIELTSAKPSRRILLFNSNTHKRDEVVSFRVSTTDVEVIGSDGKPLANVQVSLVWPNTDGGYLRQDRYSDRMPSGESLAFALDFDEASYELLFAVSLPALSVNSFTIRRAAREPGNSTKDDAEGYANLSKVKFYYKTVVDQSVKNLTSTLKKR
jgi:hypothetical protein